MILTEKQKKAWLAWKCYLGFHQWSIELSIDIREHVLSPSRGEWVYRACLRCKTDEIKKGDEILFLPPYVRLSHDIGPERHDIIQALALGRDAVAKLYPKGERK